MGLMDVLNGVVNGPHGGGGRQNPDNPSSGTSPMTMALLGLLAYKAYKSFSGPATTDRDASGRAGQRDQRDQGGDLGGLLQGGLGGLLGGGAAGSVLSGGLNDVLDRFQQSGQGKAAQSWVGTGPNDGISPEDMARALGEDRISALMAQTGLPRQELLEGLSKNLPEVVNQLTPAGRVPDEQEMSRMV